MTPEGDYKFDYGNYGPTETALVLLAFEKMFTVVNDMLKARMIDADTKDIPLMQGEDKLYKDFMETIFNPMRDDVMNDVYSKKFAPNAGIDVKGKT